MTRTHTGRRVDVLLKKEVIRNDKMDGWKIWHKSRSVMIFGTVQVGVN